MAKQNNRLQYPYTVGFRPGSPPTPVRLQFDQDSLVIPLFYSDDEARLLFNQMPGSFLLVKITSPNELLLLLDNFPDVPSGWKLQIAINPLDLTMAGVTRFDATDVIRELQRPR